MPENLDIIFSCKKRSCKRQVITDITSSSKTGNRHKMNKKVLRIIICFWRAKIISSQTKGSQVNVIIVLSYKLKIYIFFFIKIKIKLDQCFFFQFTCGKSAAYFSSSGWDFSVEVDEIFRRNPPVICMQTDLQLSARYQFMLQMPCNFLWIFPIANG